MATVPHMLSIIPDVLGFTHLDSIAPLFDMSEIAEDFTCRVLPAERSFSFAAM